MFEVNLNIINKNSSKTSYLMVTEDFDTLCEWVLRNCKGANKIELNYLSNKIVAHFEEYIDVYTLKAVTNSGVTHG